MRLRGLSIVVCAVSAALGLAACGDKVAHPTHEENTDANNNGFYVDAGPVTYQLEVSRELNQYSSEDSEYLTGLPPGTAAPKPDELWYGVFLWAKNQTHGQQTTSDHFDIVDTDGNRYYPLKLDPNVNQYAWTARTLGPFATEPAPDSTASNGPTQGALLLFKLNTSVYSNRPLTLEIRAPGSSQVSTIALDL